MIVGSSSFCMCILSLIGSAFLFCCILSTVEDQGTNTLTKIIVRALILEGGLS